MTDEQALSLLPELDREFITEKGYSVDVEQVSGALHLVFHDFELPSAYTPQRVDLLVILPAGYPNANPDMFWTDPPVRLTNGAEPLNGNVYETYGSRRWQRWSRHIAAAWRPGVDGLRSFLVAVRREVARGR